MPQEREEREGDAVSDSLPDRFYTPRVARAIMSPAGILLAGAGASAAILAGLPLAAAAAIGVAAWAGRVALAIPRRRRGERIDPFAVGDPWRRSVRDALQAQARYRQAVGSLSPGPLRERLAEIGQRIDQGVQECWRIARQGHSLDKALRQLDAATAGKELAEVERQAEEERTEHLERTAEALRAQLRSIGRMSQVATDARNRLRLLDARLDEAVARAIELSVGASDATQLGGLGTDVDSLVLEMEALRQALEETGQPGGLPSPG
jgi:hypothetical protein